MHGDKAFIRNVLELDFINNPQYWECVYDSGKDCDGHTRRLHTRVYQFKFGGILWDVGFKFVYDYDKDKADCVFDIIGEAALRHIKKGDFDEQLFRKAINNKSIKEVKTLNADQSI